MMPIKINSFETLAKTIFIATKTKSKRKNVCKFIYEKKILNYKKKYKKKNKILSATLKTFFLQLFPQQMKKKM